MQDGLRTNASGADLAGTTQGGTSREKSGATLDRSVEGRSVKDADATTECAQCSSAQLPVPRHVVPSIAVGVAGSRRNR